MQPALPPTVMFSRWPVDVVSKSAIYYINAIFFNFLMMHPLFDTGLQPGAIWPVGNGRDNAGSRYSPYSSNPAMEGVLIAQVPVSNFESGRFGMSLAIGKGGLITWPVAGGALRSDADRNEVRHALLNQHAFNRIYIWFISLHRGSFPLIVCRGSGMANAVYPRRELRGCAHGRRQSARNHRERPSIYRRCHRPGGLVTGHRTLAG